jgi:hypothetical protein
MKTNHDGTITLNAYDTWTSCLACGQRVTGDSIHTCSPQFIVASLPPKPVGYWKIGDGYSYMSMAMYKKFTPEQIKNTEELLGWVWVEGKAQEK